MRFSDAEIRQAIEALAIVQERGDPDTWAHLRREATASTPSGEPWGNATPGDRIAAELLADHLAGLLSVPREECRHAAADVYGHARQRAIYDALIGYAAELIGDAPSYAPGARPVAPAAPRPALRIVAEREDVA